MRIARKLLLVASLAIAASAFVASAASAQTLIVTNEDTGSHCSAVTLGANGHDVDGGCLLHILSEAGVVLRKHVFGIESTITTCNTELLMRLDEDAHGYILEQDLTGGSCTREACNESTGEADAWDVNGTEGTPQGSPEPGQTEFLTTNFCVEMINGGTNEYCEIDIGFNEVGAGSHKYEFGHAPNLEMSAHGVSGFRCELKGHWSDQFMCCYTHDGEPPVDVEITHVN